MTSLQFLCSVTMLTSQESDGFLIVTPEYNCSLPPALTNLLDHFPPASFRHKPASIAAYSMGPFGGFIHDPPSSVIMSWLSQVSGPPPWPARSSLSWAWCRYPAPSSSRLCRARVLTRTGRSGTTRGSTTTRRNFASKERESTVCFNNLHECSTFRELLWYVDALNSMKEKSGYPN